MERNELNVFKYGYNPARRIYNWPHNVSMFFRNCKRAWDRATKGFCDWDTWEMFSHNGQLMADMLNYLADHHYGYPHNDNIHSDEDWMKTLHFMADSFQKAIQDPQDDPEVRAAFDKYWNYSSTEVSSKDDLKHIIANNDSPECQALWKTMSDLEDKKFEEIKHAKDIALEWLSRYFYNLWD